jgi:hypothetical protein
LNSAVRAQLPPGSIVDLALIGSGVTGAANIDASKSAARLARCRARRRRAELGSLNAEISQLPVQSIEINVRGFKPY